MKGILTVTLNPAVDMTSDVAELKPRQKLRCSEPRLDPGGGGVNVSRVIKELGGSSTACLLTAGPTGEQLRGLLHKAGLDLLPVEGDGDTRISFRVYEERSAEQYRFVLPGPRQSEGVMEHVLDVVEQALGEREIGYVVASGSLPPGLPEDTFGRLARLVSANDARLILDTSGPALEAAFGHGLYLIKPDRQEAQEITEGGDLDPDELARSLQERRAAEVVIITLAAEGALVATADETTRIPSPEVEVVSTVGAGDCFVGALTFALAQGWPVRDAAAYGVAAAAAAVITEATELAHRDDVERLFERTRRAPASSP